MNKTLDAATINALLERGSDTDHTYLRKKYEVPEQNGPLRYFEPPWKRCACRGCGSPTPYRINGIPRCTVHALRELNQMLVDNGC